MKANDPDKQLFRDMQEAPGKYSDQELEAMMDEIDQMPDVEAAWQQFAQEHIPPVRPTHMWRKIAAMLIGILTISGIAFAAILLTHQSHHDDQTVATAEKPQSASHKAHALPADTIVKTASVVFDNVTLDSIARDIAAYHRVSLDMQGEAASQLRLYFVWNQGDNLQETVEKLNMFEQVNLAVEDGKLIVRR